MNRILDGFNLRGMSQDETSRYIVHHVSTISGGSGDLFDEKAMIAVHQGAAGIPRRINELCLLAMNDAMLRQQRTVSMENVRTASRAWWEN
jgi:type II secretory pathway predicted ATPase ExeA